MSMSSNIKYLLAAAITIWLVFLYADGKGKDAMADYIQKYNQFQQQADSAVKFADSLKTQIAIEENEARAAQARAESLSQDVKILKNKTSSLRTHVDTLRLTITDSTELARTIIPLQDSIIAHQDSTIKTQDAQILEIQTALTRKDTAISLLTVSRDSLQKVVLNIPSAPKNPNKMFGIPLPSRKVMAVTGFIVGVVTTVVVLK